MSRRPLVLSSQLTVPQAVDAVTSALARRGVTLFASVDHAAGARAAGLDLEDEVLLLFGNPAVGTQADPLCGLDLPLRLLVWLSDGGTKLAFHDPLTLAEDYEFDSGADALLKLRQLLDGLVSAADGHSDID